ncbi:MAG: hypothetical protein LYZ70_00105 [Nitrososphaerales archaeon]|nr:hypothetical protein [Nitrososphaerales archaeon]
MAVQVSAIPLKLIATHPRLTFRFSYDVDSLADSIRSAADENTPNGQINPGRLVLREDGEGYCVYIGVRRFLALKSLYEKTRDERFATYNAYIDTNISELQMFVKAKKENDEERGERQGVSVLEEVSGIGKIRGSIDSRDLDEGLARLLVVAEKLGDAKILRLYKIEGAANFRFRLAQLERLAKIDDGREFYTAAAYVAGSGMRSDDIEPAVKDREGVFVFEWFPGLFPDYKKKGAEEKGPVGEEKQGAETKGATARGGSKRGDSKQFEVHKKGVIVVGCPRCRGENMLQLRGKIQATQIPSDPRGNGRTMEPDTVSRVVSECSRCSKSFHVFVRHVGGSTYAAEATVLGRFKEPKATTEAVDLRFDFEKEAWQKIVGAKVVGVLRTVAPKRRE